MKHVLLTALFSTLILFVLYRRIRRLYGRQKVSTVRLSIRIGLATAGAVALALGPSVPWKMRALGLALGALLAAAGLLTTRTTRAGRDVFYTPNPWFGLAVMSLFLGRIAYRLLVVRGGVAAAGTASGPRAIVLDPVGRLLFLAIMTYVALYYLGIVVRARLTSDAV